MSDTLTVESIMGRAHESKSGRTTFMLIYEVEEREEPVFDHLCIGYTGYPGEKANARWREYKALEPPPKTVEEALQRQHELASPIILTVAEDAKGFERITAMHFAGDAEKEEASKAEAAESLADDSEFLNEGGPKTVGFDFSRFRS